MSPRYRTLCAVLLLAAVLAGVAACGTPPDREAATGAAEMIARGRYVARVSGCNDCHTAGYIPANGAVPDSAWLAGDALGYRGPWGTTYAPNLRLYMADMTEDEWVERARSVETRPPMPWFNLRDMNEADMRAFYRFVRSLEPLGEPAPEYVPPEEEPSTPYIVFVPQAAGAM